MPLILPAPRRNPVLTCKNEAEMTRLFLFPRLIVVLLIGMTLPAQAEPLRIIIDGGVIEPMPFAVPDFVAENGGAGEYARDISRVVAVCGAYDALRSERCYRPARDAAAALREIEAGSGSAYDSAIAMSFVGMMQKWGGREVAATAG